MSYRVERLADSHDLAIFGCGHPGLDKWLGEHARRAARQGPRTYVLVDERSGAVVGYFALAPHLIEREEAPQKLARGAPRRIPAVLLAKLALDTQLHGQGLGTELLTHALATVVAAARTAGGRVVVVDAVDDNAARFYQAHDFQPLPGSPHRLVMKLSTAARALGLEWP